jgi:hypothetical protein
MYGAVQQSNTEVFAHAQRKIWSKVIVSQTDKENKWKDLYSFS